jgi:hypothetical protein
MPIILHLIGVILVSLFLGYMAVYLNELPLYIVCALGILLVLAGFWHDELRGESNGQQSAGR